MTETSTENPYETYASMIAPAALGGALGVLFGRGMSRTTSNVVALSLLAASAAIAAPLITDLVQRTANRPASADKLASCGCRGQLRRLRLQPLGQFKPTRPERCIHRQI